jgi:succinate-semialdehyde dehydrogenase
MSKAIDDMVERAKKAQIKFENFSQDHVDKVIKEMAKVIHDHAEELAKMAVEETGMGNVVDKTKKNQNKAKTIWNDLKDKKSVGVIATDTKKGLIYIAKPVGVVGAVTPSTNPVVTPMANAMFALKGRNAIIIASHPNALRCGKKTVELMNQAIKKCGVPENLVQMIEQPSIESTIALMQTVDVVVATGGMQMVKSSYSSGKPAFGVGAGNVQCIIDRGMKHNEVVSKIIEGRTFDNGIICACEQSVLVPEDEYEDIVHEFERKGAYYIAGAKEKEAIRQVLFTKNSLNKNVVGKSVYEIAKLAGITLQADTKVILVEADGFGKEEILCKEKMCPVLTLIPYKDFNDAIQIAQENLDVEGKGHSCVLHSCNADHITHAGEILPVSRLVINQACSTSAGGSFYNGLAPTTTLGCGSWGNNAISENLTYKHLINVSQIATCLPLPAIPTDEELWAD